ncbi:MAG TPA: preprotein translocase subunit SecA [Actinomycetota bacterium]|nr:preprotein translocase subunit SecA [Actinomycetota bacterium]
MNVLTRVLTAGTKRKVKRLHSIVPLVNAWEDDTKALSDDDLRAKTAELRGRHDAGEDLDELLPEAFALVREAAVRTLGMRHFDVQLIGGAALHQGNIAEMRTGEGKTLVATLPAYLNALTGKGVHVVTVNDYLARRDSEWMGQVYRFLGMSVGAIQNQMRPPDRKPIYDGDIVYGTNSEFGFDYLKDNYDTQAKEELVQRGHNFAIVDEVDSILIDEARTPLIISGAAEESAQWYRKFADIARKLVRDRDYDVDEAKRTASVTEDGVHRVEEFLGIENLYDDLNTSLVHYLASSIKAKELHKRDVEYVVKDGEVIIVDEFTGRLQPGRRWSDGIHQSVEAKEGVRIREEHQTLATITIQNYFRMYEKLSGMTGTALTEAQEFEHIYKLEVLEIPTNRAMIRQDHQDMIYKTEQAKYSALVADIKERQAQGQPILVGTVSVDKNEKLSRLLDRQGIPHQLLNAKNHEQEGLIIAQAGKPGAVTVATNMAGRGVDIILGGNPEHEGRQEAIARGLEPDTLEFEQFVREWAEKHKEQWSAEHQKVVDLGGLFVLGTERHDSRRIDNQLRGRSGRQGDPGESRFYLSLGDELMQRFAADKVERIMEMVKLPEDMPIESKMVSKAIRKAQTQIEQQNFEARKNVLKYDDVLNTQREVIYAERRKVLEGEDLSEQALAFVEEVVTSVVNTYCPSTSYEEEWDVEGLITALKEVYPSAKTAEELADLSYEELLEGVLAEVHQAYAVKEAELGPEVMRQAERVVLLHVTDVAWREHLHEMDYLQEGIGLRAMGQRDPLVEYQREGYDLFQSTISRIREDFAKYIFHVQKAVQEPQQAPQQQRRRPVTYSAPAKTQEEADRQQPAPAPGGNGASAGPPRELEPAYQTVRNEETDKVGRNDPCWCGSGRKFKKCHGATV